MDTKMRQLATWERQTLVRQGCTAQNWDTIMVDVAFQPTHISHVDFYGTVQPGVFKKQIEGQIIYQQTQIIFPNGRL